MTPPLHRQSVRINTSVDLHKLKSTLKFYTRCPKLQARVLVQVCDIAATAIQPKESSGCRLLTFALTLALAQSRQKGCEGPGNSR
jgi:hypothetical protein